MRERLVNRSGQVRPAPKIVQEFEGAFDCRRQSPLAVGEPIASLEGEPSDRDHEDAASELAISKESPVNEYRLFLEHFSGVLVGEHGFRTRDIGVNPRVGRCTVIHRMSVAV